MTTVSSGQTCVDVAAVNEMQYFDKCTNLKMYVFVAKRQLNYSTFASSNISC